MSIERTYRLQHSARRQMTMEVSIFGKEMDTSPTKHKTPYVLVTMLGPEDEVIESFEIGEFRDLVADVEKIATKLEEQIPREDV